MDSDLIDNTHSEAKKRKEKKNHFKEDQLTRLSKESLPQLHVP